MTKKKRNVTVLVLGDFGRSPRMQYHSLSLLKRNFGIDVVAYHGSEPLEDITKNKDAQFHYMRDIPNFFGSFPGIIRYVLKTIWQSLFLFFTLLSVQNMDYILLQNPPSIPTLPVACFVSWWKKCQLIVDFHNYGFTILGLSAGRDSLLVKVAKWCEKYFSTKADNGLCVTKAMQEDLCQNWDVRAHVFYDCAPDIFHPISIEEKHSFLLRLSLEYPQFSSLTPNGEPEKTRFTQNVNGKIQLLKDRPALIVSSTSWTEDEDFSVLLSALEDYEQAAKVHSNLPNLIVAITGKGPLKEFYEKQIEDKGFSRIEIVTLWLKSEDYPTFLEAERLSKRRVNGGNRDISPKSILDSVDYERVLAKRKEEEARFRNLNIADILHHSEPILNGDDKMPELNTPTTSYVSPRIRSNGVSMPADSLSKAPSVSHESNNKYPELKEKRGIEALSNEDARLLEERIAKKMEEQRCQMLRHFENELRKNNEIQEEMRSMKSSSSVKSSPRRRTAKSEEDFPNFGRTGGGGEPVRDSYGNLLAMRGQRRNGSADYGSIMSFPSMQQQPVKDRMTLYREELQKQIEEKKRLEALERAKEREQEEKFAQRIEEQRLKMLEEYEKEKKTNKAKEQFQRQQERIRIFEEYQKRDAEARRKKTPEVKPPSPVPEKVQPPPVVQERSNSPPIPAVRTKVLLEKAVEAVPKVVKPENPFSSLAEIRRQIREEQQRAQNNHKKSYEVMNRRTVQEISDDEEDEDILKTSTNSYQYST